MHIREERDASVVMNYQRDWAQTHSCRNPFSRPQPRARRATCRALEKMLSTVDASPGENGRKLKQCASRSSRSARRPSRRAALSSPTPNSRLGDAQIRANSSSSMRSSRRMHRDSGCETPTKNVFSRIPILRLLLLYMHSFIIRLHPSIS